MWSDVVDDTNNNDNSFTASYNLSNLPSNDTSWDFKALLKDRARLKYQPSTKITVN